MSPADDLAARIDDEFAAAADKLKKLQADKLNTYHERQQRLAKLETEFDRLREIWRPRLETLAKKLGDRASVTPTVSPGRREAKFQVQTPLAQVRLKFSASTDTEISKLVLEYDLEILPIFQQFEKHAALELPLDAIDMQAAGRWLDDRIVAFVKTFLSLHENEYYLRDHMVVDPVAKISFPKFAAAATVESNGRKIYFISEETKARYEREPAAAKP
jgi:YHS domain-containing protein